MTKQEFLAELKSKLSGLPRGDIEERLNFYDEMIDDRVEEGMTEAEAVETLGSTDDITRQITAEIPLSRLVKEKVKNGRALRTWEIVLLIVGFPVWLPVLFALFAVGVAVYAVMWSVAAVLWAANVAIAAGLPCGIFAGVLFMVQGDAAAGFAVIGAAIACGGLAIFGWYLCKHATKGMVRFTKAVLLWIKSWFIKKEATK